MTCTFEFDACVPLVVNGTTIAEDVECEVFANHDPGSGSARVVQITLGLGRPRMTLDCDTNDPDRRALFNALAPRLKRSAEWSDAFNAMIRAEGLDRDPNAEHCLDARQLGVGGYA
jgi:hypothetical protein